MSKHDKAYIEKFQDDGTIERHHELGPSALRYVEICPGWRSTNETNVYAEEGTLLHKACETGKLDELSEEQMKLVATCLDYVETLEKDGDETYKELQVDIAL